MFKWLKKRTQVAKSLEQRMDEVEEGFQAIAEQWEDEFNRFRSLYANRENQIKREKQVREQQILPLAGPPGQQTDVGGTGGPISHKQALERQRRANGVLPG